MSNLDKAVSSEVLFFYFVFLLWVISFNATDVKHHRWVQSHTVGIASELDDKNQQKWQWPISNHVKLGFSLQIYSLTINNDLMASRLSIAS